MSEENTEAYAAFRERFGAQADDLNYRIRHVNNVLTHSGLDGVDMSSIMWGAYVARQAEVMPLQDQVRGLRALCALNSIEIPPDRELGRLGR